MVGGGIMIGFLALIPSGVDSLSDEILERAETAFHAGTAHRDRAEDARGQFKEAAEQYDILHQRGVHNAALYRNQGNAYLLAGEVAPAILAYRRGLQLAPADRELQARLAYARDQVIYAVDTSLGRQRDDWLPPWLPRIRSGGLLLVFIVIYTAAWGLLARWLMVRKSGFRVAAISFFGAAVLVAGLVASTAWNEHQAALHPLAVVAQDGVLLRKGNGLSYPPRFETALNRGVELRVLHQRGGWLHVVLSGGETGWLPEAQVLL
jgi:tetratricopeptide (TPR) repeat protein